MQDTADTGKRNADALRDSRYRLRAYLWDAPRSPQTRLRVTSCGRRPIAGAVEVKGGGGNAGLGGVSTCGSCWVCPVCSPKIAATRTVEVQDTIRAWQARGGSVLLVTLTLSHSHGKIVDGKWRRTKLADTWDALGNGWAAVRNGNGWKMDAARFGIGGYLRVVEVTHTKKNGWHPHAHVLLFVTGVPTDEDCEQLRGRLFGRWSSRLAKDGYKTLDFDRKGKAVGVDVRRADAPTVEYLAEYLAKMGYTPRSDARGLALEASRGDLKKGRSGSRTPWELLELAREGDRRALRLWQEWEVTSRGRRQYAWAQGFRESLDMEDVISDQEAAEREDAQMPVLAVLPNSTYRVLADNLRHNAHRPGRPLLSQLLSVAAYGDPGAVAAWLSEHGLPYQTAAALAGAGKGQPVHEGPYERRRQARRERAYSRTVHTGALVERAAAPDPHPHPMDAVAETRRWPLPAESFPAYQAWQRVEDARAAAIAEDYDRRVRAASRS